MINEDIAMEDNLYPWLADGSMADYASDTIDMMADRAYELEEAMREASEDEFNYVDRTDEIVAINMINQDVFNYIEPMEDIHDDESN